MSKHLNGGELLPWYRQAPKVVAAAASTSAACVSVLSFLYSFGIVGKSDTRNGVGTLGVAWVGLQPAVDTATAIGDTLHLAATITDKSGAVLLNTRPSWTSENPAVATVANDGSVIAQGAGATTITVAVGSAVARSRVVVHQQVASIAVATEQTTGAIVIPEADRRVLLARVRDARGHAIEGRRVEWRVEDTSVVAIDSTGTVVAGVPGTTKVTASIGGVVAHSAVRVVPAPAAVEVVAGGAQHGAAGSTLPQPVAVRVRSRSGAPIRGAPVRFRLVNGSGTLNPASALTDAEGRARTTWTLGALPGLQTLLATTDHVDSAAAIVAEAEATPANTRISALAGRVTGPAGAALTEDVAVTVTDSSGRLLSDVPVSWLALDGTVAPIAPRTDSLGVARAKWTLGASTGTQRLQAQVTTARGPLAIPPVTITAAALAGPPARIVVARGDAQRGRAGAALAKPIVVRVLDAAGNGVPDAAVMLAPSTGSWTDTLARTDSAGSVQITWTLARAAGAHTMGVRVAGLADSVAVTAVARPAAPANLAFEEVPAGRAASAKSKQLVARVTDVYGNPVPDAVVRFSTVAGQVAPARAVSDAKGQVKVTWTRGTAASARRLTARVHDTDVQAAFTEEAQADVKQAGTARTGSGSRPARSTGAKRPAATTSTKGSRGNRR